MPARDAEVVARIRRARTGEAPALTALALRSKAHWGYSARQIDAWRDELTITPRTLSRHRVYVAESDQRIVGFFALSIAVRESTLEDLFVDPDFIGQGVGRRLMTFARALCARHGAARMHIDADPNAEAFYLALGAIQMGAIAAPTDREPLRTRPQLVLELSVPEAMPR